MTTITPSKTPITIPSSIPASIVQIPLQKLFQIWQDLANEVTGHDTEWDYPISLDRIAQESAIPKHRLMQQLIQNSSPALELLPEVNSLTFHYPV